MHQLDGILRHLGANSQNEAGGERILYKHAGNFARPKALSQPTIFKQPFSNPPMKVALIAVFTALSLGTNYAMIDLWNIKLMDALIFIAAFLFGIRVGLGSAISTWIVYGFINPYGQADPILLVFLITGECFYAIAGTLVRRASVTRDLLSRGRSIHTEELSGMKAVAIRQSGRGFRKYSLGNYAQVIRIYFRRVYVAILPYGRLSLIFGLIGFQATFAYDVLTNFGSWVFKTNSLYQAFIIGNITGVPFAILHESSNIVFFAIVVPLAIATSHRAGLVVQDQAQ